jgi:hypothetical protein
MHAAVLERPTTSTPERSDLTTLALLSLERHPHFRGRLNGLLIEQRGKTLCVSGRLPTFYLKQLVQETLRHVPGVQAVRNDIAVVNAAGISSAC